MSERTQTRCTQQGLRKQLLATASALVLTGFVSDAWASGMGDADHPLIWIEIGGQFDSITDSTERWTPPNAPPPVSHAIIGPLGEAPRIGYDVDGRISFQPTDSDWSFSASIQFGKANRGPKSKHDQGYTLNNYLRLTTYAFADTSSVAESSHAILDFQASKDVGLGLFGSRGSSTLNFGIRMAQFQEKTDSVLTAQTSVPGKYAAILGRGGLLDAYMHGTRSFSGIGPSIAWNGSAPLGGSLENGLAFDWGANAALLFGRQKAKVRTHTEEKRFTGITSVQTALGTALYALTTVRTHVTHTSIRNRQAIVPNIGGFAGVSYRLDGRAKLSLGYRADFFFGAIDSGIETRKSENVGFYGPFASVSVGLGG